MVNPPQLDTDPDTKKSGSTNDYPLSNLLEAQPQLSTDINRSFISEQSGKDDDDDDLDLDDDDFYDLHDEIVYWQPVLEKRSPSIDHQSSFNADSSTDKQAHGKEASSNTPDHHRDPNRLPIKNRGNKDDKSSHDQQLAQLPLNIEGFNPSDLKDIHSIKDIKTMLSKPPQTPSLGIQLPNKTMSLNWLKKVINEFHYQETRTDVLADLPREFDKGKSIYTTIYSLYEHTDPEQSTPDDMEEEQAASIPISPEAPSVPDLPSCKVPATPRHIEETPAGLTWSCEAGRQRDLPMSTRILLSTCLYKAAYCPRGTMAIEKYGVWGLFCGFSFLLVLVFAVKNCIDKRQKARYRRRLVELDQRDPLEEGEDYHKKQEKKRIETIEKQHREAVQVTRAVFEEEQRRFGGSSLLFHEASLGVGVATASGAGAATTTTVSGAHPTNTIATGTTVPGGSERSGGEMIPSGPDTLGGSHGFVKLAASRGAPGGGSVQSFVLTSAGVAADPNGSIVFGIGGGLSTMSLAPVRTERSFDIRFEGLGLRLPTGVEIIKNVSGRLATGRTCAVMGPSGAGKTTFLSILAGKVAKTAGSIKVNGVEQTLTLWKKLIGFVPQEDVMLPDLTVREILMHSARMRQPVHMSHNAKRLKVLQVIQFLGLGQIMDSRIGDVETRGISGGERKRVNIGMELVASPSILFLDEPTSGLDSATSLEVCKLLKQIARDQALTVAAVVHSPSPHAFQQFDDLLLLGAGGRVVYFGPRDRASAYFESIGFPTPGDESPADFYIRLAAGRVDRTYYPLYGEVGGDEMEERTYGADDFAHKMYGVHEDDDPSYRRRHHTHHSYDHRHGQHLHQDCHDQQQHRYHDEELWRQQQHQQQQQEQQEQQEHQQRKATTPDDRIRELFAEWENTCRRKELAKNIEKHAIHESETMTTVQLSGDESTSPPLPSTTSSTTATTAGRAPRVSVPTAHVMHQSPLPLSQYRLVHQQHALEQQTRYPTTRPSPGDIHTSTGFRGSRNATKARADDQRGPRPPISTPLHPKPSLEEEDWDVDPSELNSGGSGPEYFTFGQTAIRPETTMVMANSERDGLVAALHQPSSCSPSPTVSVAISNLAGSLEFEDNDMRRPANSRGGGGGNGECRDDLYCTTSSISSASTSSHIEPQQPQYRCSPTCTPRPTPSPPSSAPRSASGISKTLLRLRISLLTNYVDTVGWIKDVGQEWMHWMWTIKCWFTRQKDPVRETPSMGTVFLLCFQRACLQIYRSPREFLSDQSLHLACGLCVSFAVKDMTYIPRQPAEICALAPISIQLQCATPIDDIPYVGMFMCLGIFFAGISVGITTFGHEKAVFWRDTSAGMPTMPYYLAKVLADIPRVLVAACLYTGAFIFFFSYRQTLSSLLLIITLLYINAFVIGYCVSALVSRSMFALVGTGMALTWSLVFSGTAPHLIKVMRTPSFKNVQWLWAISGPRWGVEAFYLKEMKSRE
ncbi:hypothetical protein DFQ27_004703 [Actinomortierella ambigua]|uniref:ABC transporter domain-containing protein n=1 Tax=Actinomortierella ambigua TaxID=1343610 RepID=A0A9P6QMI4_9FUNG|nr:hypothetical protein DFQ27_004703 [Actinomortierella ambigua]